MKVAIIIGTRPEIIKMSPVIRELLSKEIDFFIWRREYRSQSSG